MIKEKFIVTDGEKVTDEIYRVTGLDIEIDQIIENISSEESNIYFFDKDLSEKPEKTCMENSSVLFFREKK